MSEDAASVASSSPGEDADTLRFLVSTDNHLGYCERDPVRGGDSFAAFEEVLASARRFRCDAVLLAGDLFHENRPSRSCLHRTMSALRRHTRGSRPVRVQVLNGSGSGTDGGGVDEGGGGLFRSAPCVNFERPDVSVDLPVFCIHGNHDDPARDGSAAAAARPLAALDLLATADLVNYFGAADRADDVRVRPVLLRKGGTHVALYGLGNLRDERLNRAWRDKRVRFLRPTPPSSESSSSSFPEFFNLFALHQNRDAGRGSRNCVRESMIPEWMDLVVWGHEHECSIDAAESLVGTFRISQPGSSVATSLVAGEAVTKRIGVLDVRGDQFRMQSVPLDNVRAFATGEVSLRRHPRLLDPDDPRVDEKLTAFLEKEVEELVRRAKERREEVRTEKRDATERLLAEMADADADVFEERNGPKTPESALEHPDQVLVRLRVEHSGFSTLNNQRFGARFVGRVANPSDVLLFHRRKDASSSSSSSGARSSNNNPALVAPVPPEELAETHVDDLIRDHLCSTDERLELLDESALGTAMEEFVTKEQHKSLHESVDAALDRQRKRLIRRGADQPKDAADQDALQNPRVTTVAGVREICRAEAERNRRRAEAERERETQRETQRAATRTEDDDEDEADDDVVDDDVAPSTATASKRPRARSDDDDDDAKPAPKRRTPRSAVPDDDDDDDVSETGTTGRAAAVSSRRAPARRARAAAAKYTYDDDDEEVEEAPPRRTPAPRSRATTSSRRAAAASSSSARRRTTRRVESDDDDDDDDAGTAAAWGTTHRTQTTAAVAPPPTTTTTRRSRRRG